MVGGAVKGQFGFKATGLEIGAERLVSGLAGGVAGAASLSLINGSDFGDNIISTLPSTIAQTIGSAVAGALTVPAGSQAGAGPSIAGGKLPPDEVAGIMKMLNDLPVEADVVGRSAPWVVYGDGGINEYGHPIIRTTNPVDGTMVDTSYLPAPVEIAPTMSDGARFEASANNAINEDFLGMVNGFANFVNHPVDTTTAAAKATISAVSHPIDTTVSAWNGVKAGAQALVGNYNAAVQSHTLPEFLGSTAGHVGFAAATVAIGGPEVEGAAGGISGLARSASVSREAAVAHLIKNGIDPQIASGFIAQIPKGQLTARIVEPGEQFFRYSSRETGTGYFLTQASFASPVEAVSALHLEDWGIRLLT
jgi:hypothetical protein